MTTEGHDEGRIRRAVVAAVEGLEGPDRGRLARIEQQLLAQRRRRRANPWWWAVLGLGLAAGAAAGYWGLYAPPGESGAGDAEGKTVGTRENGSVTAPRASDDAGEPAARESRSQDEADPIIYIGQ